MNVVNFLFVFFRYLQLLLNTNFTLLSNILWCLSVIFEENQDEGGSNALLHCYVNLRMYSCMCIHICVKIYTGLFTVFSFYSQFFFDFLYISSIILYLVTINCKYFSTIYFNLLVNSIEIIFSFSFIHLQYTTMCVPMHRTIVY